MRAVCRGAQARLVRVVAFYSSFDQSKMWIWEGTSSQAQGIRVVLVPEKQAYLIGRAAHPASDIVIDFDKSVSRTHATLQVNSEGVWFKDGGSRLGSFLNGTQIKDANQIKLKDGDELKLGAGATVFRLRQLSPVIVFSGVKSSTKAALTDRASAMGFTAFENFNPSCTHLIMTSLKITMKTVQAVAHGTHIVTDAWLKALDTNCKGFPYSFPNEADFVPTVREENLTKDQFVPNAKRKTLFNGKKFLFFDAEEIPIFGEIVAACGGTVVDCAEIVEKQDKQGIIDLIKKHKDPFVIAAAATTQQESVFVDDDDDDDLFQALFRKKGKAKAAGTQIPPTPLNPTITQKKPATQKPPLYIPQTLSIPPDSQILATQNSAIPPSTAIPSSFSSSSSAAIPNSQPAPPSNPSKFMPPPPPPAPKSIYNLHHHHRLQQGDPPPLSTSNQLSAHSSQLLKVTKFPTYSIDEDESVIFENEESFMIGDGEDAVPPSPVTQKTVPSAAAAAAAAASAKDSERQQHHQQQTNYG
ncbi:hypothetical protein BDR26DRAFT_938323 [Obelidium mucronatum]|nr:hypothetical protein BDR26DRAFT_938323 [Obelidium mucronatum]